MAIHLKAQTEIMADEKRKTEMVEYFNKRWPNFRHGKVTEVVGVDAHGVTFQCENGKTTWCGWF